MSFVHMLEAVFFREWTQEVAMTRQIRRHRSGAGQRRATDLARILLVAALCAGGSLIAAPARAAGIDPVRLTDPPVECPEGAGIVGRPFVPGRLMVGETVDILGSLVSIRATNRDCSTAYHPVPAWSWDLKAPLDSQTAIRCPTGPCPVPPLEARLDIDVAGPYVILFTPCPEGCSIGAISIEPQQAIRVPFTALSRIPLETVPPEPLDPIPSEPTSFAQAQVDFTCGIQKPFLQGKPSVFGPQWVTASPPEAEQVEWLGADDFAIGHNLAQRMDLPFKDEIAENEVHAVEGFVREAKISEGDNRFNHHSQDHNWNVILDPRYRAFLFSSDHPEEGEAEESTHNEWEIDELNLDFAPSAGDRVSMFGFWIHDCGHEPFRTEIHPPIGLAVHRPRAVPIPDDRYFPKLGGTVGSNVWVPGIITEVRFNRRGGKLTDDPAEFTGLAQPCCTGTTVEYVCGSEPVEHQDRLPCDSGVFVEPRPLTALEIALNPETYNYLGTPFLPKAQYMIHAPTPRERIFVFRIYLPRSPKRILEEARILGAPDVPLYWEILNSSVPVVQVVPRTEGGADFLEVHADLRGILSPARNTAEVIRIASAWVYPAEDNWGLRRWRFAIPEIHVFDDADGPWRGEGEWNLWVQLNNAGVAFEHREWTRILHRDMDDDETHRFGGRPWTTGPEAPEDRNLGPDLLLFDPARFPEQVVHFHASGYEYDGTVRIQDKLSMLDERIGQFERGGASFNYCQEKLGNFFERQGCGRYRLEWTLEDLGAVAPASLTPEARALAQAYETSAEPCIPDPDGNFCPPIVVSPEELPMKEQPPEWHPEDVKLLPGDDPLLAEETLLLEAGEVEENSFMVAGIDRIAGDAAALLQTDPERLDEQLAQLSALVEQEYRDLPEVLLDVQALRAALPDPIWKRHFGRFPLPGSPPGASLRRMTGGGSVESEGGEVRLALSLHCDPVRQPNRLDVWWGTRRFELDLMTAVGCDEEGIPMRTFQAAGIGRLDGERGASAEWLLEDQGEPGGRDRVRLSIREPGGETVLDVDAPLSGGNLQGHVPRRSP